MNPQFEVLGIGRTPMSSEEFRSQLRVRLEEMEKNGSSPNHLFYVSTPASVAGRHQF
jgi:glucose-6-phosphate 1-dehydrogenase